MSEPAHIEQIARIAGHDCQIIHESGAWSLMDSRQLGGRVSMTFDALINTTRLGSEDMALFRRRLWELVRSGGPVRILSYDLDPILDELRKPFFERMALDALHAIERYTPHLGASLPFGSITSELHSELITILCVDTGRQNRVTPDTGTEEIYFCLDYLRSRKFIDREPGVLKLRPEGLMHLEEASATRSKSEKGFVAMWFDPSMDRLWHEAIDPGVRAAGYDPYRVDKYHHQNKVDDEIVAQIRKSRFLVADFSCELTPERKQIARGGVYFEAGLAMGLNIPVIWCARKDCIDGVHFDTRQYPHLLWQEPGELKDQLTHKIEAVIGHGPLG